MFAISMDLLPLFFILVKYYMLVDFDEAALSNQPK